ncbi:MAG: SprT-like domain-containing protein [Candidatus Cloacimonetes bacterium]|nr:SprT-like domain-containing protein [Candidatus Cloacimonadota bacterium]
MTELIEFFENVFKVSKYGFLENIEKDFKAYLEDNNLRFFSKPEIVDLEYLFSLYDKYFFAGKLAENFNIILKYSNKLTRSAGLLKYAKRKSEVNISVSYPLIFVAYIRKPNRYIVNGETCKDPIEALMRVLEHEIAHLIEFVIYGTSNCNNANFMKIAYDLFGHTENKHLLGIELYCSNENFLIKKGDIVSFTYYGKIYTGMVVNIKKNIAISVDGLYGTKKYYVPFDMIIKENFVPNIK